MKQVTFLDFTGLDIYCGLDVHKKNWSVCIRDDERELKTFSQPPEPKLLSAYLNRNYPGANYHAIYEAGFCGFWIQRALSADGIDCRIIHAADVPTSDKEKRQKTDTVDCRKLAQVFCDKKPEGIYIPSEQTVEHRNLVRGREQLVQDQTRYKNRILSFLNFMGIDIPEGYKKNSHFSKVFMTWLEQLPLGTWAGSALQLKLNMIKSIRAQLLLANRQIRSLSMTDMYKIKVQLIRSISGIGLTNAMIFLTEFDDIRRFSRFDSLANYAGLIPDVYSSSDKMVVKDISPRCNHLIRESLVEGAWMAISKDPALLMAYKSYKTRMHYNKAIIKIAKKLLRRIRYVLVNEQPYVTGVVK